MCQDPVAIGDCKGMPPKVLCFITVPRQLARQQFMAYRHGDRLQYAPQPNNRQGALDAARPDRFSWPPISRPNCRSRGSLSISSTRMSYGACLRLGMALQANCTPGPGLYRAWKKGPRPKSSPHRKTLSRPTSRVLASLVLSGYIPGLLCRQHRKSGRIF